ncbi:Aldo-ket-red domain-containing protein [Fusarium keratoplasticum]|uniref:Aldo-ket-red domain-containing protein n=1 Tax=Fusarium keratoplasticum TaxID=1328300 RepID=A0ACC0RCJ2_9HYPO|nr:Aldo-ket-red domain-containing protein [Fusarium keratoplasticum]KAI8680508.1 Aldo-ket-red domain-containing protein [Fusarium keratoplasticum]
MAAWLHTSTASAARRLSALTRQISTNKPRVILGLMTFGPPGSEPNGARMTSLSDFKAFLDYFQGEGYAEIDTVRIYVDGKQEAFTRTDSIDIFYLHAPDRSIPFTKTLEAVNDLYSEGKFRQLGLSNYAAWEVSELWNIANKREYVKPTVYQAMYNAITRDIDSELVPCCRKYGINIIAYNPLAGGALSGKYKSADIPSEGRFSSINDRQGQLCRDRFFKDSTFEALRYIEPVVQKHNLTLVEVVFRWVIHHGLLKFNGVGEGGNDGILVGVGSLQQLKDNLDNIYKGPLPEEVVQTLGEA